jgi:hypothetical protein
MVVCQAGFVRPTNTICMLCIPPSVHVRGLGTSFECGSVAMDKGTSTMLQQFDQPHSQGWLHMQCVRPRGAIDLPLV